MGMHLCEYCFVESGREFHYIGHDKNEFVSSSTGDSVLYDPVAGVEYSLPDMALHYVADHSVGGAAGV